MVERGARSHSITAIAQQVGVGQETLRVWRNRYSPEARPAPVVESLQEQNKRLKRVLAEARRAIEILKAASGHLVRGYGFYYRYDSVAEVDLLNQL
ncbi:transposase [Bowdeniella massiliensis]|uniref:transposase n=1 Tax=Bowdeniella massiliensis TaxID=2932264 RepID=UPI0032B221FE